MPLQAIGGRRSLTAVVTLCCLVVLAPVFQRMVDARDAREIVITEHGAVGDGRTLNTKAIQGAIDLCADEGGGQIVVPKGVFLTGALFLKQGVDLWIEKDGVLQGSVDPRDYPQVATRWEGVEREWTAALLNAIDLTGVEVAGEGVIDGSGDQWLERYPRELPPAQGRPSDRRTKARPKYAPLKTGKPRLLCFQSCRRVRVAGLTLRNQAVWCLHVLYSEDVVLEDLLIRAAHTIPSSDGIDVDSSRRVRIKRCDIDVNDDCITIKAGKDEDGLRVGRPSEDIQIESCRFGYGHGGVAMGSETSGGIRKVMVRDCMAEADNWAPIRFKTQPSRGGVVEDITFRDFVVRDTRQVFEMNMLWRMVPPIAPPAKDPPVFRDVKLINVTGTADAAGVLRGLVDSPIENVKFKNCKLAVRTGLVIENAEDIDLSGLKLDVKEGPAIIRVEVAAEEGPRKP